MIDAILMAEKPSQDLRLLVEDAGPELGYYLYVMRISTSEIYKDHLCDDMEMIYRKSKKDYRVDPEDFHPPKG